MIPLWAIMPIRARTDRQIDFLIEAVSSVIAEDIVTGIVVVDDGSPIKIPDLERKFPKTTLLTIPPQGKSVARNTAAAACPPDSLILPVDGDDMIVPGALKTLVENWEGIPIYTDLGKWYDNGRVVYLELPDYDSQAMLTHCCAAVTVLHSRSQWQAIGGWNPSHNLFEDWEYNGRLFACFGAQRIGIAGFRYRQHADQSSRKNSETDSARRWVYESLTRFYKKVEDDEMSCCGGKRRRGTSTATPVTVQISSQQPITTLDRYSTSMLTGDSVSARYVGGHGKGAHIYRGIVTRYPYRVIEGATIRADPRDTTTMEAHRRGESHSLLIRIDPPPAVEEVSAPVESDQKIVSIADLSAKEILAMENWSAEKIEMALLEEKSGKNRLSVIKILERKRGASR